VQFHRWRVAVGATLAARSVVADTPRGRVEYARIGDHGPAILILHGTPGGYDQGSLFVDLLADSSFQYVVPSRPGFLRTPIETGRTAADQADAAAALLDVLGLPDAAVVGVSAGGPVAIEFAARYPRRCWALGLVSAVTGELVQEASWLDRLLESDFTSFIAVKAPDLAVRAAVERPEARQRLMDVPENRAVAIALLQTLALPSLRSVGNDNDMLQWATLRAPMEQVTAPSLVFHGTDDREVPYAHAERAARALRACQLVPLAGGDHASFLWQREAVWPKLSSFLREQHRAWVAAHAPGASPPPPAL
jgi:pimeloyl-ACP methyl ester carboxylesterase